MEWHLLPISEVRTIVYVQASVLNIVLTTQRRRPGKQFAECDQSLTKIGNTEAYNCVSVFVKSAQTAESLSKKPCD